MAGHAFVHVAIIQTINKILKHNIKVWHNKEREAFRVSPNKTSTHLPLIGSSVQGLEMANKTFPGRDKLARSGVGWPHFTFLEKSAWEMDFQECSTPRQFLPPSDIVANFDRLNGLLSLTLVLINQSEKGKMLTLLWERSLALWGESEIIIIKHSVFNN